MNKIYIWLYSKGDLSEYLIAKEDNEAISKLLLLPEWFKSWPYAANNNPNYNS